MNDYMPWLTLVLLGAYHGLNPGMGWLFAVALGLQERSRAAVIRAFAPIALGHAASIAVVVALVGVAQSFTTPTMLRIVGASALVLFGVYKLLAPLSHPRWVGMRVNSRDLAAWSFLMATAHGAGLMLVPVLLNMPSSIVAHSAHAAHTDHALHIDHIAMASTATAMPIAEVGAVALHTVSMFLVMGGIAVVVYEKFGLAILRRAWFNLDRVWAGTLIATGVLTFIV